MPWMPALAKTSYFAVKRQVDRLDHWNPWQRIRRGFKAPIFRVVDTGFLGLTPLKKHVLICGFPAAGTTLMQLMLETGLPQARRFGRERSGWKAATYSLRNHEILISKQPRDIFRLERLREFYRNSNADLRIILMLRDPRDLLTAQRKQSDGSLDYCGSTHTWIGYYDAFLKERNSTDTLVVRYEDLVTQSHAQQQRVEEFIGEKMRAPFTDCPASIPDDFDTTTLCGVRPVESSRIARWRLAQHDQRLAKIFRELPELPEFLCALGYLTQDVDGSSSPHYSQSALAQHSWRALS